MSRILSIFTQNNILDNINSNNLLKIFLKMVETREFFDIYDELYKIDSMISSLNDSQKRQFYEKIIRSQNPPIKIFRDHQVMSNCTVHVLGELLYDIDFLNCFPENTTLPMDLVWNNYLARNIDQIDILKIVNNKDLFAFYSKCTSLFWKDININLSEEQIKQLITDHHYWALKYTDLKLNEIFVQKLIIDSPKNSLTILKEIPDSVKNSKNVGLALLIAKRIDLFGDMNLKEEVIGTIAKVNYNNISEIIDMTGKKFDMVVHVVGAYGAIIPANNMYESWNTDLVIENTAICTSLLNDNYFGHANKDQNSVIFGFNNISALDVQMMATYDLY